MEQYWITFFATFLFVLWVSAKEEELYATPNSNWLWETNKLKNITNVVGWWGRRSTPESPVNRYTVCDFADNILQEPNSWLLSKQIDVGDVQRVDVTVRYSVTPCSTISSVNRFCKNFFNVYVWESDNVVTSDHLPHPINDNSSYRQFANISGQTVGQTNLTIPLQIKSKFIVLGFRDQGGCRTLFSVKVTFNVCPGKTLADSLVSLPQTLAPSNDLQSIQINGSCTADSVHVQGSLNVLCESSGEWNMSRLEGRCICNENMENTGGTCTGCLDGTFNDGKGLNCTVLPSHPRNVQVSFVNQSSAMITWKPPVITGGRVFYEVDCETTCKECDEKTCDSEAGVVSHKKSSHTDHVKITTLSPFVNYTCKIMAKNRVSEVAARNHRVYANVIVINLKTQGSVPGTPEVFVQQAEDAVIELSWQLKCKNGIIKKYHVTYHREDDYSVKETLATNSKETKVRIEKLAPGETFAFQVVAENNYGRGPAGEETFEIPSDDSNSNMVIYIVAVSTVLIAVLFIVLSLFGLYVYRRRTSQNKLTQSVDLSEASEGDANTYEMEELTVEVIEERNMEDAINHVQTSDNSASELERDDIGFVRLQRTSQSTLTQSVDLSEASEGDANTHEMEELTVDVIEERNMEDAINHVQTSDNSSFELQRDDIGFVRLQRTSQSTLTQSVDLSEASEGDVNTREMEEITVDVIEERNMEDAINHVQTSDVSSFELERDNINFVRLLGSGNFGEVYEANMGHVTVAVKSLKETATAKDKKDMVTELNVMKSLKPHPHVVKLIGCCRDPLLIILEYLPYGNLLEYLKVSRGHSDSHYSGEKKPTSKPTAKDLLSFSWMIADGMKYLAKMKIVHRDLAARNILVGEDKVCKISDFGLARDVNADIYVRTSEACLPVKWMPPESLFRGESSTMSDVWSYGIVLWEVFTFGGLPYPGKNSTEVRSLLERGYRMSKPIHISEELFSIFSECWSEKPEDRPTFQWICAALKRLIEDKKTYVNLDVYNDEDYVNFDMVDDLQ